MCICGYVYEKDGERERKSEVGTNFMTLFHTFAHFPSFFTIWIQLNRSCIQAFHSLPYSIGIVYNICWHIYE